MTTATTTEKPIHPQNLVEMMKDDHLLSLNVSVPSCSSQGTVTGKEST